ncbi:hypothetical protein ILUMI_13294 [Ignelater luminosus]|uniref:Cytochrome b5 heme-binding domain-containing protein n=1 Tax=Ignelater luminosus TaxID=2038154 RepID=A0A8K0CX04_IGNLU|nr:hypothetical protein ILUMI_13294 [Ignelater luminosus]
MPPKSTIGIKTPFEQNSYNPNVDKWLDDKRAVDGAGDLWRIHDGLYDFTKFIKMHPGGQFWLQETQGMDITEAFESHHISIVPETLLKHYFIKQADTPRASPFTFHGEGFYKTLKENVREIIKDIPRQPQTLSNIYSDSLLAGTFFFAIIATRFWNFYFGIASALLFSLTIVAAHNYSHQRDNLRMHYSDFCMEKSRDWRILHILSHHLFTNTIADLQAYGLEPLIITYPQKKPFMAKYGSWFYLPFLLWPTRYPLQSISRLHKLIFVWKGEKINLVDYTPYSLPFLMYFLGSQSLFTTIMMWEFILAVGGFIFGAIAFTSSHFHPDIFIDGDTARKEKDWGMFQLDCIADRKEVAGNHFLVLVTFGDHALHHLFPTLDHGILKHLYPVVIETMKKFKLDLNMKSTVDMFTGYFRQVAREEPNLNPPGFKS